LAISKGVDRNFSKGEQWGDKKGKIGSFNQKMSKKRVLLKISYENTTF